MGRETGLGSGSRRHVEHPESLPGCTPERVWGFVGSGGGLGGKMHLGQMM